ncbi:hypothetical protein V6Z11_D13G267100 [Gossypium hirsutum]
MKMPRRKLKIPISIHLRHSHLSRRKGKGKSQIKHTPNQKKKLNTESKRVPLFLFGPSYLFLANRKKERKEDDYRIQEIPLSSLSYPSPILHSGCFIKLEPVSIAFHMSKYSIK